VPRRWVVGDDEFGRASEFRAKRRTDGERYVLDVPCNTTLRDLEARRPARKRAHGGVKPEVPFVRVDRWAGKLPADRWTRMTIRDGEKGPLEVEAVSARVRAKQLRRIGPEERMLVIRTVGAKPDWTYSRSNAPAEPPLVELVRVRSSRHRVEEVFQQAKGEVGLDHDEIRSWVGWHHHVTPAFPALWFLILERGRMGGKTPAVTVAWMRAIFSELLRKRPPTGREIAESVRRVLRRGVTRRLASTTGTRKPKTFPPRKVRSGFS
jgi:SRSO17 transposase